jgi:Na+/phosphate symporter
VHHLKWIALPVAAVGLILLFFGLIWIGVVQLVSGAALVVLAAGIWRITTGTWPLTQPDTQTPAI